MKLIDFLIIFVLLLLVAAGTALPGGVFVWIAGALAAGRLLTGERL